MRKFGPFCFGTGTNFPTLRAIDQVFSNSYIIEVYKFHSNN